MRNNLEEIGFFRSLEQLAALYQQAAQMVESAGYPGGFQLLPSFIPAARPENREELVLSLDIGGTSTKAGLRSCSAGVEKWEFLFDLRNKDCEPQDIEAHSLEAFASGIVKQIKTSLPDRHQESELSIGIVWSNALDNRLLSDKWITGIITKREEYKKGEWFVRDLKNGDDLGEYFKRAFAEVGLKVSALLIANDTPLTMKALPEASAGMVASTGVNGTIVSRANSETDRIFNAEMGWMPIGSNLLGSADRIGAEQPADRIEFLIAGKFLPKLLCSYVLALGDSVPALADISEYFSGIGLEAWNFFRGRDITYLLRGSEKILEGKQDCSFLNSHCLEALAELAENLVIRSAKLATVVAYGTLYNQLADNKPLVLALDSRLAREMIPFRETFLSQLGELNNNIRVKIVEPVLLEENEISVPMQGAAVALDSLN